MAEEKKKRTKKQKKFIKGVIETGKIEAAASLAGLAPKYGHELARRPDIRADIQLAMKNAGLTEDTLAKRIKEGQKATYVRRDGGTKYKDFHAIHKFCDMQIKIGGGYAPEKTEHIEKRMVFNVTPDTIKALRDCEVPEEEIEVLVGSEEDDVIDAEIVEKTKEDKDE